MSSKEARFLQLLEAHKGVLYKICRIYEEDADARNDLLQEMILQLWVSFDTFRGDSQFSTWMYRVALNTAIVFFKKEKRRPDTVTLPVDNEQPAPSQYNGEAEIQLALFYKAVKQLSQVEKALVFLYMENQTYEEMAANMGITPVNARVRLNRIKNKIKEMIKTMGYES